MDHNDGADHLRTNVEVTRADLVTWLLRYRRLATQAGHGPLAAEPAWLARVPVDPDNPGDVAEAAERSHKAGLAPCGQPAPHPSHWRPNANPAADGAALWCCGEDHGYVDERPAADTRGRV